MKKALETVIAVFVALGAFTCLVKVGLILCYRLDAVRFSAWGTYLAGAGTVVLAIAAVFTGVRAVQEYSSRNRTERAKWVFGLYEKFYEHDDFKKIRQKIDFEDTEQILVLIRRDMKDGKRAATFSPSERLTLDQFTDYLNFFEMIAWLWKGDLLSKKDVLAMFHYYLKRLVETRGGSEIRDFIDQKDYENLKHLLVKCVDE
jgi:hypothetical protein